MKLSARNQLKGKVININKGAVNSIVTIDISIACIFQSYELIEELTVRDNLYLYQNVFREGETEYSKEIIEELGLEVGSDAYAVIKATNVMVGIDE